MDEAAPLERASEVVKHTSTPGSPPAATRVTANLLLMQAITRDELVGLVQTAEEGAQPRHSLAVPNIVVHWDDEGTSELDHGAELGELHDLREFTTLRCHWWFPDESRLFLTVSDGWVTLGCSAPGTAARHRLAAARKYLKDKGITVKGAVWIDILRWMGPPLLVIMGTWGVVSSGGNVVSVVLAALLWLMAALSLLRNWLRRKAARERSLERDG